MFNHTVAMPTIDSKDRSAASRQERETDTLHVYDQRNAFFKEAICWFTTRDKPEIGDSNSQCFATLKFKVRL